MEEENLFEYEGVSYPESALREIYPETFDEYVEQGILKKLGDEEPVEVEGTQEESLYEYEGVSYPESSLRDLYPDDFDDYVEQGVLTKVDGLGKQVAVEDSAAARDMDLVSEDGSLEFPREAKKPKYLIDGKEVNRAYLNDNLYKSDFVDKLQEGTVDVEIFNDPKLEELLKRQSESGSQWGDKIEAFNSGLSTLASGVVGAPGFIVDVFEEITGVEADIDAIDYLDELSEDLSKKAEELNNQQRAYKDDFIGSISEGNILDAVNIGFNTVSNSAPIMIAAGLTGGAGGVTGALTSAATMSGIMIPAEYASTKISEDEKIKELSDGDKLTRAFFRGGAEGVFEGLMGPVGARSFSLFKDGVKNLVKTTAKESGAEAAKEVAEGMGKKTALEVFKTFGISTAGEGGSEALTSLSQDLTDDYLGIQDLSVEEYMRNAAEAGALGVFMGGVTTGALGGAGQVMSYLPLRNQKVYQGAKTEVREKQESGEINNEEAKQMDDAIESAKVALDKTDPSLSEENQERVAKLIDERERIKLEIEGLDENQVPVQNKKNRIDEINKEISEIGIEKPSTEEETGAPPTPEEPASVETAPAEEVTEITKEDYDKFVDTGVVDDGIINYLADKVRNNEELNDIEQAIFNDKTSEVEDILKTETATAEVEKLRAEEQAEMLEQIPDAENALTDGKVDREKITTEEGKAKFDEIYSKYDEKISPLLETAPVEEVSEEVEAEEEYKGFSFKPNYKPTTLKTPNSNIDVVEGAGSDSFEISTKNYKDTEGTEGATIIGYVKDRDFPGEKKKETRGEIFILQVNEKGKGTGTSLMLDALKLMKENGTETVKFTVPSKEGKPFNETLVNKGYIELIKVSERTGTSEYKITDKVLEAAPKTKAAPTKTITAKERVLSKFGKGRVQNKVRKQVENARKALSKIAKGVTIEVYETQEEFEAATNGSAFSRGVYDPSTKTIKINLEKANPRTVAHEVFHALLLKDGITNARAQKVTSDMMAAVRKVASPKLLKELDAFSSKYDNGLQSEESIAELFGILAANYESSPQSVKDLINDWIRKLAKALNVPVEGILGSDKQVLEFLDVVSGKVARGEVIEQADIQIIQDIDNGVPVENTYIDTNGGIVIDTGSKKRQQLEGSVINESDIIETSSLNGKPLEIVYYDNFTSSPYTLTNRVSGNSLNKIGEGGPAYSYRKEIKDAGIVAAFTTVTKGLNLIQGVDSRNKIAGDDAVIGVTLQNKETGHLGNKTTARDFYSPNSSEGVIALAVRDNVISEKEAVKILKDAVDAYSNTAKGKDSRSSLPFNSNDFNSISEFYDRILNTSFERRGTFNANSIPNKSDLRINKSTKPYIKKWLDSGITTLLDYYESTQEPYTREAMPHDIVKYISPNLKRIGVDPSVEVTNAERDRAKSMGVEIETVDESLMHTSYPVVIFGENVGIPSRFNSVREMSKDWDAPNPFFKAGRRPDTAQPVLIRQQKIDNELSKASGTTQVATTTGSYVKAAKILNSLEKEGEVLDYGAGLGLGTDAMSEVLGSKVDSYELNPERWKGKSPVTYTKSGDINKKYDAIVSLNVVNVVPKNIRDFILEDIYDKLKIGGVAAISSRAFKNDIENAKNFEKGAEDKSYIIKRKKGGETIDVYQKGFDGNELVEYVQDLLGDKVNVYPNNTFGQRGVIIEKIGDDFPQTRQQQVFRAGDLADKAETIYKFDGPRSTGHFGTGFYFFGKKQDAQEYAKRTGTDTTSRIVSEVNLDDYNLAPASLALHKSLKDINDKYSSYSFLKRDLSSKVMPYEIEKVATILGIDLTSDLSSRYAEDITKKLRSSNNKESASTLVMKALGFDGVDATGTELDNSTYGTVVYDIKPQTRQQQAQDDFTIQDVIQEAEKEGLTRKETIEVLEELGFTKEEIRSAIKPKPKRRGKTQIQKAIDEFVDKKIPSTDEVSMSEKQALNKQIRDFARGMREAYKDQRNFRKRANKLISDNFQLFGDLTPSKVKALTRRAINIDFSKPDSLDKFIDYAAGLEQKTEDNLYKDIVNDVKKKTSPSKLRERKGGILRGKIANYEGKVLSNIHNFIKENDVDALQNRVNQLKNKQEQGVKLSENDIALLDGAIMSIELLSGNLNTAQNAQAKIEAIIEGGKSKYRENIEKRATEYTRLVIEALPAITGGKKLTDQFGKLEQGAKRRPLTEAIRERLSGFLDYGEGLRTLLDKIDRTAERDESGYGGVIDKELYEPIADARREKDSLDTSKINELSDKLNKLYGKKKKKALRDNQRPKNLGTFTDRKGNEVKLFLSQNQAYPLYQYMQDPSNMATFEAMGFTDEMLQAVEDFLTPEIKDWADWQMSEFFPKFHPQINVVYKDMNDIDLPKQKIYVPVIRILEGFNEKEVGVDEITFGNPQSTYKSLKQRQSSKAPFDMTKDGNEKLMEYIEGMNRYIAFAKPVKRLNVVFKNKDVRNAIREFNSEETLKAIDGFIEGIANNSSNMGQRIALLDKIRGNVTIASLALAPTVTIKQLTSIPAYASDIPISKFISGLGAFAKNPKKVHDILMESEYMQRRYKDGFERDLEGMKGDYDNMLKGTSNLKNKMMFLIKWGDKGAILMGGYSVYKYHFDKSRAEGKSIGESKKIALSKFEEATKLSQQSINIEDLSHFQRMGSLGKLFTMYMTSPMSYFRQERKSARDFVKGYKFKDKKLMRNAVKRFTIYHFVLPLVFQYVASGLPGLLTDWDEEDEKDLMRAASIGSLNGVFIAGQLISYFGDILTDKAWVRGGKFSPSPAFDAIVNIMNQSEDVIAEWNKNPNKFSDDLMKEMIDLGFSVDVAVGLPVNRVRKLIENWKTIADDNDLETREEIALGLGFSPYVVTPKKKSKTTDGRFKKSTREPKKSTREPK